MKNSEKEGEISKSNGPSEIKGSNIEKNRILKTEPVAKAKKEKNISDTQRKKNLSSKKDSEEVSAETKEGKNLEGKKASSRSRAEADTSSVSNDVKKNTYRMKSQAASRSERNSENNAGKTKTVKVDRNGEEYSPERLQQIRQILSVRKRSSKVFYVLAFLVPLSWLALIITVYFRQITFRPTSYAGFVLSAFFFLLSMILLWFGMGRLYLREYTDTVTLWSLSGLLSLSVFLVLPFRYKVSLLPFETPALFKALVVSLIFSGVVILYGMLVDRFRMAFSKKRSMVFMVLSSIMALILLMDYLLFIIIYRGAWSSRVFLMISLMGIYVFMLVGYTAYAFFYKDFRRFIWIDYLAFVNFSCFIIAIGVIGYFYGDFITWRTSLLGGMYSLFICVSIALAFDTIRNVMDYNIVVRGTSEDHDRKANQIEERYWS